MKKSILSRFVLKLKFGVLFHESTKLYVRIFYKIFVHKHSENLLRGFFSLNLLFYENQYILYEIINMIFKIFIVILNKVIHRLSILKKSG